MGDTYQSPAFGWLHAARAAGSASLTVDPAPLSSTPKTRLVDGMLRRNMAWSAAGTKSIVLDRGTGALAPLTRLVIPDGHNLAGMRMEVTTSSTGAFAGEEVEIRPYSLLRGSSARRDRVTVRPGVNPWDFAAITTRYVRVRFSDGPPAQVPELGELWWTQMRTPKAGLRPRWERKTEPRIDVRRLPSGTESILETGPASSTWAVDTQAIDGDDRRLYEALLASTGYGRDGLVFDLPEGGYETTLDAMDTSAGSWSQVGAAGAPTNTAGVRTEGTASMLVTAGASPTQDVTVSRSFASVVNAERCYIGFDVRLSNLSGLTSSNGVVLTLADSAGTPIAGVFGTDLVKYVDTWYTAWFDTESDGNSGAAVGFDFSRVASISIMGNDLETAVTMHLDHLRLVRKERAPLIARVDAASGERQSNINPAGAGTSGSRELAFVEVVG